MRRPLVHRFTERWRTDAGNVVLGSLQDAPDVSQEADFLPRRIMVLPKGSPAAAGTVLSGQGQSYLLVDQVVLAETIRFRAYLISHRLPWLRKSNAIDPVTQMPTTGAPQLLSASLPVVVEPLRLVSERGIERPKYRAFSGADVRLGDKLGDWEVHTSVQALGVHLLEVY